MGVTKVSRQISAPIEDVFSAIADIDRYAEAIPHITSVKILGEQRSGLVTKFRETRNMNGREIATELESTEYDSPHRVRFVSDDSGTIWDTLFEFKEVDEATELKMEMRAKPYKLMARVMNIMIRGFVNKAIKNEMDAVKSFCESNRK